MNNPTQHRSRILGIRRRLPGTALALVIMLVPTMFASGSAQAQSYAESVLYTFTGADGNNPIAGLVMDAQGNLYGTTFGGGTSNYGAVFKLDTTGKETVLYSFTGGADGAFPWGGLVMDAEGNLYGTTYEGGLAVGGENPYFGLGVVFKVDPTGKESVLYSFTGSGGDGSGPVTTLVLDAQGNLYGTAVHGGDAACV